MSTKQDASLKRDHAAVAVSTSSSVDNPQEHAKKTKTTAASPTTDTSNMHQLLLNKINKEMSMSSDAAQVLEQLTHALIVSTKTVGAEHKILTLPLVQDVLGQLFHERCAGILKYGLDESTKAVKKLSTPTGQTSKTMPTTLEETLGGNPLVLRSIGLEISSVFQSTGHSITEPASLFLSAFAEYLSLEICELTSNNANDNDRKEIVPVDIKIAVNGDEELTPLFNILQVSLATINDYTSISLVAGSDGQVTQVKMNALVDYWEPSHWASKGSRASFNLLSHMDWSSESELHVVVPNVTTSAIRAVCDWHFDGLVIKSTNKDGAIINDAKAKLEKWTAMNAADPTLYAHTLMAADFLGCEELCSDLLQSFHDAVENPIEKIQQCCATVPNFCQMLFHQLGFPNVAACDTFLQRLISAPQELTYMELQLCDGMYLCKGALCNVFQPSKIPLDMALSPLFQKSLCEQIKEKKEEKDNASVQTWNISTHLNLTEWTKHERARRQAICETENNAHALARALLLEPSPPSASSAATASSTAQAKGHALDESMWQAVASNDLVAAKNLYKQGACANLWYDDQNGILPHSDLLNKTKEELSYGLCGTALPHVMPHGLTTLMKAAQQNNTELMNWLIDVGVGVNIGQPASYGYDGDGGVLAFGGATAIVCASSPDAVNLLLSRGASVSVEYTPPQYSAGFSSRPVLATHLELRRGLDRDLIARALVRHGARVNQMSYPCFVNGQESGEMYPKDNPPVSYFPSVVASGDVCWAKELIEKYNANVNWPHENGYMDEWDYWTDGEIYGVGATVLQIAIMNDDLKMVQMLLEKPQNEDDDDCSMDDPKFPADANALEVVAWWPKFETTFRIEADQEVCGISLKQRKYYWGKDSWDECNQRYNHDRSVCVKNEKKASPLSIALAIGNEKIIALLKKAGAVSHPENAPTPITLDWRLKND